MQNLEWWMENILFEYHVKGVLTDKPFYYCHYFLVIQAVLHLGN
jgi:hypothetical protein